MSIALVLTYHAVEPGPAPLCIDPQLFAEHLDTIVASGARAVTVRELAAALREGKLGHPTVAITFDDGLASVAENAAPALADRGLPATVFCVAGHVGGRSDWPSARPGGYRAALATARQLVELADAGVEIGSHGMQHTPLVAGSEPVLRRELVDSRLALEQALQTAVTSYAYPYGAGPTPAARRVVADTYEAACTTVIGLTGLATDPLALPRIDAHYVRRPGLLRRALAGSLGPYVVARRLGARTRRLFVKDFTSVEDP